MNVTFDLIEAISPKLAEIGTNFNKDRFKEYIISRIQ